MRCAVGPGRPRPRVAHRAPRRSARAPRSSRCATARWPRCAAGRRLCAPPARAARGRPSSRRAVSPAASLSSSSISRTRFSAPACFEDLLPPTPPGSESPRLLITIVSSRHRPRVTTMWHWCRLELAAESLPAMRGPRQIGRMTAAAVGTDRERSDALHGQVCLKGTRVPVSVVLDCLAAGMAEADILRGLPVVDHRGHSSCRRLRRCPGSRASCPRCPRLTNAVSCRLPGSARTRPAGAFARWWPRGRLSLSFAASLWSWRARWCAGVVPFLARAGDLLHELCGAPGAAAPVRPDRPPVGPDRPLSLRLRSPLARSPRRSAGSRPAPTHSPSRS